jgi:hypothetical protein
VNPSAPVEAGDEGGRVPVATRDAGRYSGDPAVSGSAARPQAASSDFRRLWAEHEVPAKRMDRKTVIHPRVRELLLDTETLVGLEHRQRLMALTPADNETREQLELPQALGSQEFSQARETSSHGGVAGHRFDESP